MAKKKKTGLDKDSKDRKAKRDAEIEEILGEADRRVGEQMVIDNVGEIKSEDEIKHFALGDIPDDPEKKYDVYYKGIEKLLRTYLPRDERYEDYRKLVREEKNIFLTRGKKLDKDGIRGGDSRMGYIQDMEEIMNAIANWAHKSMNYSELYFILRDKNKLLGYHESDE